MHRVMLPCRMSACKTSAAIESAAESVVVEKACVHEQSAAKPTAAPSPPETPAAPAESPTGIETTEINSGAEAETKTDPGIEQRRIVAPCRRTPHIGRIVYGNVNDLRIGGLNHDRALSILILCGHVLLRRGPEPPVLLRAHAHALHRRHHIVLLREKGIAEIGGPLHVLSQRRQHIGKRDQRLHARVPVLLPGRVHQLLSVQVAVLLEPLLGLHDFKRIGGGRQHLAQ